MKAAEVVIGANFGDEGKGLITDFLSSRHGSEGLVVRYNGGAQAGHTVTTPGGQRHVFSHFGSGSFAGAATLLSRFFVCNPLLFVKEHGVLSAKTSLPTVYADARAPVTTPYDMMVNQIAEEARGKARHGSCGVGFGETIGRNEVVPLTVADLRDVARLRETLKKIRAEWMPRRLAALGVRDIPDVWRKRIDAPGIEKKFLEACAFFLDEARMTAPSFLRVCGRKIVFEGAQGLLLDQDRGWFPHVTRSHTGLRNVIALADEAGIGALSVTYATRAYATRHGAGPMPHELFRLPYAGVRDETNVPNAWQGTLRFGWLDASLLASSIALDLSDNRSGIKITPGLAVTCLDQTEGTVFYASGGRVKRAGEEEFLEAVGKETGARFMFASRGPTRADVTPVPGSRSLPSPSSQAVSA
jgi:adenylosuccinate synthase